MRSSRFHAGSLLGAAALFTWNVAAQQPFALDPTFRAQFNDWYVSSILPLEDGKLIVSGQTGYPGAPPNMFHGITRLNADGSWDPSFNSSNLGRGKLVRYGNAFYVATNTMVRRILMNGSLDPSFASLNSSPYFSSLQGGDYHVYPDGSLLVSGAHSVNLPDSGWSGLYNLIWFTNTGRLDTTRAPRKGNGVIYRILELPDGKFMCTGPMTEFEGQPTSYIFRVHADGMLDTSFYTGVFWGQAACYLPLPDGRCYVGGLHRRVDTPDTLQVVRLMPDGTLDPTFNNTLHFGNGPITSVAPGYGFIESLQFLDEGRLIVTGAFRDVDGALRNSIALIDTTGQLLDDHFVGAGCGTYTYQGFTDASIMGLRVVGDSMCYVWGSYHGYSDGVNSDPLQRFVTRLYGPDFSTGSVATGNGQDAVRVYPNPASSQVVVEIPTMNARTVELVLKDAMGRTVLHRSISGQQGQVVLAVESLARGLYLLEVVGDGARVHSSKLVVQ
jgi:uncharacterized delta-60 repeat protein